MSDESMEELPESSPDDAAADRARPLVESFEWLPALSTGARLVSVGYDVNTSGHVTGIAGNDAFLWDGESLQVINTAPSPFERPLVSVGTHINAAGQVLGRNEPLSISPEPWIFDGGARSLGAVLSPEPGREAQFSPTYSPTGLSDAGAAVGMAYTGANVPPTVAWLAQPGGEMQAVPVPAPVAAGDTGGDPWFQGNIAINNYGDLLVSGISNEGTQNFPVFTDWRYLITAEGGELELPSDLGRGLFINDRLQAYFTQNVLYDIGTEERIFLDDSPYVGPSAKVGTLSAQGLSSSGLVVGGARIEPYAEQSSGRGASTSPHLAAFVWKDDVTYHLKDLLIASGFEAELDGGFLGTARGVSDNGWITGSGRMSDGVQRAFALKLLIDPRWAEAVDGVFSTRSSWTTSVAPGPGVNALFDVPGAYTVTFDEAAEHRSAAVLAGDVGFALAGNDYRLQSLSVQSTDDLSVAARVLGTFETEDGISAVRLPDGRLTVDDVFVGPRGILSHDGWLLVGDVFLDDFETAATRDGTDVDLHVIDRLRVAAGGRVGGAEFDYGAIVDGAGETGLVQIDGFEAIMRHMQIEVGGVHGGVVEVIGGGQLVSDTILAVGADVEAGSRVRVAGFAVDFDGEIVHSSVEASTILLGQVGLPPGGPREGALLVEERGHVYADEIRLGFLGGMRGELEVRGEGSRLAGQTTTHSLLEVGVGGEGLMLIREGAQVFAATTIGGSASVSSDLQFGDGQVSVMGQGADVPAAFNTLLDSPLLKVGETGTGGLLISDGGRVETNRALIGEFDTGFGSVIVVGEGSILDLSFADAELTDVPGPVVFPQLWVGREGGARLQVLDGGSVVVAPDDAGVMHVGSALVEIRNGGSITSGAANIGPGATVIGDDGSWQIPEGFTMNLGGRLEIGSSPGRFLIDGDLTVLETGVIEIEFAGLEAGQYDVLEVTGDLYLGGTLALSFIDGYQPGADDVFDFLKVSGSVIGDFDQVVMTAPDAEPAFDLIWEDGSLRYATITPPGLDDLGDLSLTAVQDSPPVSGSVWPGNGGTSLSVSAVNGEAIEDEVEIAGALGLLRIGSVGAFQYDPNAAQRLPEGVVEGDVFVVTVTDQDGRSTDVTIDFNVAGINDPASIAGDRTGAVTEDDPARQQSSGVLTVTDPDEGENRFREPEAAALQGTFGSFTFAPLTGAWSYTLDNESEAVQALPEGEQDTDSLTVTSFDGTASETVTVTITGTGTREVIPPGPEDTVTLAGRVVDRAGNELPGAGVTFTPQSDGTATVETEASGRFVFVLPAETVGHLDATRGHSIEDPIITASSALETLRMAVGLDPSWGPAGAMDFIAADFNGDGQVNAEDALEILRVAVGLPAAHAPRWLFINSEADLSEVSRSSTQIETGLRLDAITTDTTDFSLTGILIGHLQE